MKQRGFTLIELILVVVIISVIAAFGLPRYNRFFATEQEKVIVDALQMMHAANELYLTRTGAYYLFPNGAHTNLDVINAALDTDIIMDPDITFTYPYIADPMLYRIQATNGSVTIAVDQNPLAAGGPPNPYCLAGNCQTVPAR